MRGTFPLQWPGRSISCLTMMESAAPCSTSIRVLGIDPGTRILGYGILDAEKGGPCDLAVKISGFLLFFLRQPTDTEGVDFR